MSDGHKFSDEIHKILYQKTAREIDWNEIDKLVSKCIENSCSHWDGYSGDFWESPIHGAIDMNDIEMVKKLLDHGGGILGDADHYRCHVEDLGCDWTYKEFIIANMKLDMMKALDIRPSRKEMIEARECIFKQAPDTYAPTEFMKEVSNKTYEEFMDKVMDWQYNDTMGELNRIVPGSVNKQNINYNKTIQNINNILYPPKNTTKKKNEMLVRKAKRALTNKKGGRRSSTRKKRRV